MSVFEYISNAHYRARSDTVYLFESIAIAKVVFISAVRPQARTFLFSFLYPE